MDRLITEMNLTLQMGYLACNLCMLSFSRTFIKYLTVLSPRISLCKTIGMNIIHSQFACCIGMVRPWDESSVKSRYVIKSFTNFFFLLLSIVIIIVGAAIVIYLLNLSYVRYHRWRSISTTTVVVSVAQPVALLSELCVWVVRHI